MCKIYVPFLGGLPAVILALTGCQQADYSSAPGVVEETYVHRYGVPVSPEDWNASGNHGQIITTLDNGVVVSRSYNSGILDGDTTYSYPHSSGIEKVENYMNGIQQKESNYYISGAPRQEIFFNTPQNRTVSTWYELGTPLSHEQFQGDLLFQGTYYGPHNQVDSQVVNYQGVRTQRDDYGQLTHVDTIDNGMTALRTTYHQNGTPKEVIPYSNGIVHGQVKSYFPGGEPQTVVEWNTGVKTGLTTEYLNGEKISECPYVNGKKQGIERRYKDGHTVVQEISWHNDQKQGPSVSYLGNTTKTEWYWQGKQVSKVNYDIITGQGSKRNIWNTGNN